jgi:murein L,D-transpeptidase YafK
MNKLTGRLIGDIIFFCFAICFMVSSVAILATPARSFVWKELQKLQDLRGQESGPKRFAQKLAAAGLSMKNFRPRLLLRKKSRQLVVLTNGKVVATYTVGLGRNPHGIKLNGDDQKTPEGLYHICAKDDEYKYHLFLQLNYPAPDDAKRGSVQQLLKPGEEEKIMQAWNFNRPPPTDTALGGPLGIHGFGAESNWTKDGSIAMHNYHLEELFWVLATGTSVAIVP